MTEGEKHIWITYSWQDNKDGDVTFIAQQLQAEGLNVHLDKWDLTSGHRLWEQIDAAIASKERCDAWMIVATQNSLSSEPCREEVAYALNQALSIRGPSFPIIALFPGPVEASLLPQALSTRLCVTCTDANWKERIAAAAGGRPARIHEEVVQPYAVNVHDLAATRFASGPYRFAIEVRPRAGMWAPFIAGIPLSEKDRVGMDISRGPRGNPTPNVMKSGPAPGAVGGFWCELANEEASPVHSYYVWCRSMPTSLVFGASGGPQFTVEFTKA